MSVVSEDGILIRTLLRIPTGIERRLTFWLLFSDTFVRAHQGGGRAEFCSFWNLRATGSQ